MSKDCNYPTLEEVNHAQPSSSNNYPSYKNQYPPNYSNLPNYEITKKSQQFENLYEDTGKIDSHQMMRAGFIIKVYGILAFQLSLTVAFISLIFIPKVDKFFQTQLSSNLVYVSFFGALITIILLSCFKQIARRIPINYILLILFTVFQSYLLQFVCSLYEPHSVLIAGVLTAAVTITLAFYALKTKTDYTSMGAFLFCCITILLLGSIISIFWRNYIFETLCACIAIVIYSIYLIYDIQLISGKFGQAFDIEDYIMAAMNVYIDIVGLFLRILQILGVKKKN